MTEQFKIQVLFYNDFGYGLQVEKTKEYDLLDEEFQSRTRVWNADNLNRFLWDECAECDGHYWVLSQSSTDKLKRVMELAGIKHEYQGCCKVNTKVYQQLHHYPDFIPETNNGQPENRPAE